jgi:type VI secretion system protein ImpA
MDTIDVDGLLKDLTAEDPCGSNLEYDPSFLAMEEAARGKPEREYGKTRIPAEPPKWTEVRRLALSLSDRTRDLRVAVYLAKALLATEGLAGLANGLALMRGLVERHWLAVHPRLDPAAGNDPTLRINTIASLCDAENVLRPLRETPLARVPSLGSVTLRAIDIAAGTWAVPEDQRAGEMDQSTVDAVFTGCDLDELRGTAAAVAQAREHAVALVAALAEHTETVGAVDLGALEKSLARLRDVLAEQLAKRSGGGATSVQPEAAPTTVAASVTPAVPLSAAVPGQINSAADVIRVLDSICAYYARHEPSSPVPLLLQRAKRLVSKDFLEILRDLTPDGVAQAELIGGVAHKD